MVPGSTLMYGSSLMLVTRIPRDSRIAAREAAAMPFPREETTPPVTKTYLVIYLARGGTDKFTGMPDPPQIVVPLRQRAARGTHPGQCRAKIPAMRGSASTRWSIACNDGRVVARCPRAP